MERYGMVHYMRLDTVACSKTFLDERREGGDLGGPPSGIVRLERLQQHLEHIVEFG